MAELAQACLSEQAHWRTGANACPAARHLPFYRDLTTCQSNSPRRHIQPRKGIFCDLWQKCHKIRLISLDCWFIVCHWCLIPVRWTQGCHILIWQRNWNFALLICMEDSHKPRSSQSRGMMLERGANTCAMLTAAAPAGVSLGEETDRRNVVY